MVCCQRLQTIGIHPYWRSFNSCFLERSRLKQYRAKGIVTPVVPGKRVINMDEGTLDRAVVQSPLPGPLNPLQLQREIIFIEIIDGYAKFPLSVGAANDEEWLTTVGAPLRFEECRMNLLTFGSPRIEVVLSLAKGGTLEAGPFDAWLVLNIPDGKPTTLVKLGVGLDQSAAYSLINSIFTHVVERFG